jgi:hypothetical protein
MSQNKGTLIASELKSFNTEDTFPYADTSKLKGGHMQVDTIAQRDAIPMERRKELMLVSVVEDDKTYKLYRNTDNGELSQWKESVTQGINGADAFVTVQDVTAQTASQLDEGVIAFYKQGKNYSGVLYKYFIVRIVSGAKKLIPLGITYITTGDNGINAFDPITEQYIQIRTWESLQGKKGDDGTPGLKGDPASVEQILAEFQKVLPAGIVAADGSKRERFLDIICAGAVNTIDGARMTYWGENKVDGYPFKSRLWGKNTVCITHNYGSDVYGVMAMMYHCIPQDATPEEAAKGVSVTLTTEKETYLFSEEFGVRDWGYCHFIIFKLRYR